MLAKDQKKFEDLLLHLKILSEEQLKSLKTESAKVNKPLDRLLIEQNLTSEEDLVRVKSLSLGIPYVKLKEVNIPSKTLNILSREYCEQNLVVPFETLDGQLKIAMADPYDVQVIDFVEKKTGLFVIPYIASQEGIKQVISQYEGYTDELEEALKDIEKVETQEELQVQKEKKPSSDVETIVQDAPITTAVNKILEYAVKSRASDIHIEPRDKGIVVRYRIDGILQQVMALPKHIQPALISRIKILSNLKIDEHRIPQDGRFQVIVDKKEVDLRVSISPIVFGEKIVIRLLDKSSGSVISLEQLGLFGRAYKKVEEGAKKPWGMILSTGPTGSGKSTSLYAILGKINSPGVNIITLEDPVEYNMDGINQIQINPKVGLTFASGLRSVLRQDPDIIMVGEIRDKETADLAVQSALTGHVVLSTLHTNNAAGVLPRLLDMKIEPFLIASTVNTVMGQRLVRKICDSCRESYKASQTEIDSIKNTLKNLLPEKNDPKAKEKLLELGYKSLPFINDTSYTLYRGRGCKECHNTGFKGRIGIFEVFQVTEKVSKLLLSHATSEEIQDEAVLEGMITMKQDGYLKVVAGITTMAEVGRVARD